MLAAVAWLGWDEIRDVTTGPTEVVVDKSIAVLPFDDFSPDGDQVWFADGLTEEILNSLARIGDLHVASRTSTFAFRGSDQSATEIADELGVAHILEGSVRRAGNQLRVTAQLIRASDDKHLWSDTFDGDVDNSISIQEKIATNIATALQTAMDPEELERMISAGTASVEAWELYLHAMALRREDFERIDNSRTFEILDVLDQAVAIDPDFVSAHEQLRDALYVQLDNSTVSYSDEGPPYEERRERFDRALEATIRLARSDVERLAAEDMKANIEVRLDEQLRIAEQLAALAPDDPDHFRRAAALYRMTGRPDKAYESMEQFWSLADARVDMFDSLFIYEARRIDLDRTVAKIESLLVEKASRGEDLPALFYYQAHRAFLDAGKLDRAADMIDAYNLRAVDSELRLMVQIRQACAEGRDADANAIYEEGSKPTTTRWLMLRTLGRDDEARELVRQYDTPEKLFILAGYLQYRTFDPRDFPLLWSRLQAQGIDWAPVRHQTFRCKGGGEA